MPLSHRLEKDSLGEVQVPTEALYGAQTARALENFKISGKTAHPALIRAYLLVKIAAARANQESGALTSEECELIIRAAEKLLAMDVAQWEKHFPVDPYQAGAGTALNMNLNEVIANLGNSLKGAAPGTYSPLHPNDHVNRSQSTNDTFPTAMRLALLQISAPLVAELRRLAETMNAKARLWWELPKAARTHLQDAVPMRLGQEFQAYGSALLRCAGWLETSREALRELGIGGAAAGTGLTVPPSYRAAFIKEMERRMGEKLAASSDLCEAMQSQAPVGHYSSMLRLTALELTRICNDLRLLASGPITGLAEIGLPAVQPGSSIMPGKVNPSILEMANQVWFSVLGYDQTLAYSLQAGQLELNVMMPVMAYSAIEATRISTQAIATLREKCIEGLEANEPQLRKFYESTPQIATALSPRLGYDRTAQLVQESLRSGKSIPELVREKKLIDSRELDDLLSPRNLVG